MSKIFQNKNILQKIAIVLLIAIVVNFTIPTLSFAGWGGDMLKVLVQLLAALGDVFMGAFNKYMLGTDLMIGSVMLDQDNPSIEDPNGALYAGNESVDLTLDPDKDEEALDGSLWGDSEEDWEVPNLLYSPEAIFTNSIAALDVNFLNPNTNYQAVQDTPEAEKRKDSAAADLQNAIGSWYVAFRNIAIVALLTVLVYIGIRILISSTSSDKAKYKESLKDWLVAICLVFMIHFIMSAILMLIDQVTLLFGNNSSGIVVQVGDSQAMKLSLMGVARLRVQSADAGTAAIFCIMYIMLVVYTVIFTFTYLKRFLYMAFLTMIAPLVAITYPLDKLGDGKAQAFNYWFKEYLMNAILQPLHLILYTTLIGTAQSLVKENFIYAIVAIAFLIPAEKFVKSMFNFGKADSAGSLGGFAAGALAMTGLNKLAKAKTPFNGGNGSDGNKKIRTADNDKNPPITGKSEYKGLDSVDFGNEQDPNVTTPDINSNNPPKNAQDNSKGKNGDNNMDEKSKPIFTDGESDKYYNDNYVQDPDELSMKERFKRTAENIAEKPIVQKGKKFAEPVVQKTKKFAKPVAQKGKAFTKKVGSMPITKTAIRGAKSLGNTVWKNKGEIAKTMVRTAARGTTAALGAGIGLAAGLATGDYSKAFQYASAGLWAGDKIGKNAANTVMGLGERAYEAGGNVVDTYREERDGIVKAQENKQKRINDKAMKAFMHNKQQLEAAKKTQVKLAKEGYNVDIDDIMKSRYDYIAAGINDNDQIQRAQIGETKSGGINGTTHGNYIGVAQYANDVGIKASTFADNKKYNEFHDVISSKLGGEANGAKAMKIMAEIHGEESANDHQSIKRQNAMKQATQTKTSKSKGKGANTNKKKRK